RRGAAVEAAEAGGGLAAHRARMVVYLAGARARQLQDELLAGGAGYPPDTPAAVVVRASWPDERVLVTTVGELAETMRADGARITVLVLVGPALAGAAPRCRLYDPAYAHGPRRRSASGTTTGRPR